VGYQASKTFYVQKFMASPQQHTKPPLEICISTDNLNIIYVLNNHIRCPSSQHNHPDKLLQTSLIHLIPSPLEHDKASMLKFTSVATPMFIFLFVSLYSRQGWRCGNPSLCRCLRLAPHPSHLIEPIEDLECTHAPNSLCPLKPAPR
jgi:hypothetical protein